MTMPIESPTRHRVLRRATISGALLTLGVILALAGDRATADDAGRGRRCSDSTLRGDYGLLASGVRRIPFGPFTGQSEMIVGAGEEVVGTYSVNPDCTGTSTFYPPIANAPPVVGAFVVVDSGRHIKEAVMQPTPNVVTVVLERK